MIALAGDSAQGSLDWLVGCWVTGDNSSQEVWVADSDNLLIGFGVTIAAEKVAFYEVLTAKRNDKGEWIYTAHPSGQESASFISVEFGQNEIVFANPDHDYPQKISYRREGNQLYATASLRDGGKLNAFDKISCE